MKPPSTSIGQAKPAPRVDKVVETSLYVEDVARSMQFYQRLFSFQPLMHDERFCAFNVAGRQVLLLFKKGASTEPIPLEGGVVPPHDGAGRLHLAFAISETEHDAWLARLRGLNIPVESQIRWMHGGRSMYFRDPDGHLLELITPGCWEIY